MKLSAKEMTVFSFLGALMYASKVIMEALPNVHLLGAFVVALTVVYGKKALYPIYVYVFINGLLAGFSTWWLPYLYIWTVLWGMTMILPKNIPEKYRALVYMTISAIHGYSFGTLYAPAQALLFGLDFKGMISWIIAGLPYDFVHGTSNFICGVIIVPLIKLLQRLEKNS